MENELNLENVEPKATFEVQTNELNFDAPKSSSGGTKDYEKLENLPSINGVELVGNKTTEDLKIEIPKVVLSNHYNKDETDELLANKEDKRVYVDGEVDFNPNNGAVSFRGWRTENPYQVIDEANKKGHPAILRVHLYVNNSYMENLYMLQSIYSDSWWGKFKFFLGFVDDVSFAYLRVNQSGSTTIGLKQF